MTPDPEQSRYHIYVIRRGQLRAIAMTSKDGIGTALVQLHEDGEFDSGERVGVLDRLDGDTGTWIVNPWA